MPSPSEHRTTRPLLPAKQLWQEETGPLDTLRRTEPLSLQTTSQRAPTIIPAERRRTRVAPQKVFADRRTRRLAWPIVLLAGSLIVILALSFAVPLGTDRQQPVTLVQGISNLITTGQFGNINTAQLTSGSPSIKEGTCGTNDIWGACAQALLADGTVGTGQFHRPVRGAVITQPFGTPEYQTWCGCVKPHSGIDLAAPYGSPVMASDSGEVIWVGWDWSGLGWAVKISHGNYLATIYGHLASYTVKLGQLVDKGQVIAYEGSTGASTGPHVHFMVLDHNNWVNPADYMSLP